MSTSNNEIGTVSSRNYQTSSENFQEENFHPISWLQSVGQFLGEETNKDYLVSNEGLKSVKDAVV